MIKTDKLELLLELLRERSGRVIIWCWYIETVDNLDKYLQEECGYRCYPFHGKMSDGALNESLRGFEEDEEGIFIPTIKKGGKGLNLQYCDTAIFYELAMVPSLNEQAEDRIYRIGQKNAVTIHYLYGKGTMEEALVKLNQAKKSLQDIVLTNKAFSEGWIKKLVGDLSISKNR